MLRSDKEVQAQVSAFEAMLNFKGEKDHVKSATRAYAFDFNEEKACEDQTPYGEHASTF